MSALIHHERFGGLSSSQVKKITELITAILAGNGVFLGNDLASVFYSDLYLALSRIERKEGEHFKSAWNFEYVATITQERYENEKGYIHLGRAYRALRLGHSNAALRNLILAQDLGLSEERLGKSWIEILKVFRLTGNLEAGDTLTIHILKSEAISERLKLEIEWETVCRNLQRTSDFLPLIVATRPGGTHYNGAYILETVLWLQASSQRNLREKYPSVGALKRRANLRMDTDDPLLEIVQIFEQCYDTAFPMSLRLYNLGRALVLRSKLILIENELLTLAAAFRFCFQAHQKDLMTLCFEEYRLLCHGLSLGKSEDVLNLFPDLNHAENNSDIIQTYLSKIG